MVALEDRDAPPQPVDPGDLRREVYPPSSCQLTRVRGNPGEPEDADQENRQADRDATSPEDRQHVTRIESLAGTHGSRSGKLTRNARARCLLPGGHARRPGAGRIVVR